MADRIGIINKGEIILVEEKAQLMKKLGSKELKLELKKPLTSLPSNLSDYDLKITDEGKSLVFTFDTQKEDNRVVELLDKLHESGISFRDLSTTETSLEDIFIQLVRNQ